MNPTRWAEAEGLWETGEFSLDQLSGRFGVRRETLSRHFTKRGVRKGSKSAAAQVRAAAVDAAIDVNSAAFRAKETKEDHYRWSKALSHLTMKIITEQVKAGESLGAKLMDLKTVDMAQRILTSACDNRYKVLGLDNNDALGDELPELVFREFTGDEVDLIRNRQVEEEEEGALTPEELALIESEAEDEEGEAEG